MRRRFNPRTLKRSLLAAACVLAIASATIKPAATHTAKPADAGTHTTPATIIPQPRRPPSIPPAQPRAVATTVARAYASYLDHQPPAQPLPALTPRAMAIARQSGPLPAPLHVTQVQVTSVTGARRNWTAHFAIRDAHGRQTTSAQLALSATRGRWQVSELIPPDPDTLIAPNPPAAPPTGPAAARRAALGFTQSYLAYTYGHAAARQLRDLTPALQAAIAANPPQVPATTQALHPRIASVALTRDGARWLADANVTDGQNTYQVTSVLARIRSDWLANALRSAG
jgi:hypothetical protein